MTATVGGAHELLAEAHAAVHAGAADVEERIERALAVGRDEPLVRADAQALRVRHWNWCGNVAGAAALAQIESELVAPYCPDRAARLAVDGLLGWIHVGDMHRAEALARETLASLARAGNRDTADPLVAATRIALAWALIALGDPEGDAILASLEDQVASLTVLPLGVTSFVGILRAWQGRTTLGRSLLLRVRVAARHDDPGVLPLVTAFLADVEHRAGAWGAAEELAVEAQARAHALGALNTLGIALVVRARLEVATGRHEDAIAHLDEANAISLRGGTHTLSHMVAAVRGNLALLGGDVDAAVGHLRATNELTASLGVHHPGLVQGNGDLIEALFRAGLPAEAAQRLDTLERAVHTTRCSPQDAGLDRARIVTCADEDVERIAATVRRDPGEGSPFERARTLFALGVRRRRLGDRARARADLGEALCELERLGAHPWAELVRVELRAAGGRVREEGTAAQGTPSSALTPQELQVAHEVGRGATNREVAAALFLSVKTIERHLTSIYAKLGLRSRSELLVWLAGHGLLAHHPTQGEGFP